MKSSIATKQTKSSAKKGKSVNKGRKAKGRKGANKILQQATSILIIIAVSLFLSGIITPQGCSGIKKGKNGATPGNLEIPAKIHDRNEQIIEHTGYTVSYNETLRLPNWVAYELLPSEVLGNEERSDKFIPDPQVIGLCPNTKDYTKSGYDRGHMAPAADMKWSETAMKESFYMTNICPQNHSMNAGIWKAYEERGRMWATTDTLWIVCGPIVETSPKTIGENKVAVPTYFFKTFLKRTEESYSALGILCPNVAERKKMRDYVVPVDYIETLTGIDLYPSLPDSIENQIEAQTPFNIWGIKK